MWDHAAIRRAGLCLLLSLALPVIAAADSTTSTPKPDSSAKPSSAKPASSASAPHSQKTQGTTTHHAASKSASKSGHGSSTHSVTASHNRTSAKTSGSTTGKRSSARKSAAAKRKPAKRGQQVIDSGRAREIQEALIREHYLEGEPSGTWDSATQAAMQRYQEAQGWQSKTIPDSRALIKLGLGPSTDHLLNPDSAMTSAAGAPKAESKQTPADPAVPQR